MVRMDKKGSASRCLLLAIVALLLGVASLPAQQLTGSISGIVKDSSGAVIPGADITITKEGSGEVRRSSRKAALDEMAGGLCSGEQGLRSGKHSNWTMCESVHPSLKQAGRVDWRATAHGVVICFPVGRTFLSAMRLCNHRRILGAGPLFYEPWSHAEYGPTSTSSHGGQECPPHRILLERRVAEP